LIPASQLARLDVLVNNATEQRAGGGIEEISEEQLQRTFRTDIFGYFQMTRAALPHLSESSSILNTSSITAFQRNPKLLDYSEHQGGRSSSSPARFLTR
jgi:NAD(P)-dependent dehydrogenase (short-subunit alcohol dehydrogenase family)